MPELYQLPLVQDEYEPRPSSVRAAELLTRFKYPLEGLVPPINYDHFEDQALIETMRLLASRKGGRTFTILTAMDPDGVATHVLLRKLHPEIPVSLVYPRMENQIDRQRQGRRDRFVSEYDVKPLTLEEVRSLITRGQPVPLSALYEFWVDDVVEAFRQSTGLSEPTLGDTEGLFYNNALGTILNSYWTTVANATRGVPIGSLNGTALGLGDYYHHGLGGEFYPLASLLRTDVNRLLHERFGVPSRLRDLSPWQQKVRGVDPANTFWATQPRQQTDQGVVLLPRNFYRLADPVLVMLDQGIDVETVKTKIKEAIFQFADNGDEPITDDEMVMIDAMIDAAIYLKRQADGKNLLHQHRFPRGKVVRLNE